ALPLEDGIHPVAFDGGQMLDEAAQAQRACRWRLPRLLVGQTICRQANKVALLREVSEKPVALVSDRSNLTRHACLLQIRAGKSVLGSPRAMRCTPCTA